VAGVTLLLSFTAVLGAKLLARQRWGKFAPRSEWLSAHAGAEEWRDRYAANAWRVPQRPVIHDWLLALEATEPRRRIPVK
jgi:hypothetical protein